MKMNHSPSLNSSSPRGGQFNVTKQRLKAFLISLPFQLISIVGWLLCFGGFVWSHFKGLSEVYGQPVSEILFPPFAFLLGTPIFHIIYSLYVLTDLWILGLFTNLGGALCIAFGGYTFGIFYVPVFDDSPYKKLTSAGAGISVFALVVTLAPLPVFWNYCHSGQDVSTPSLHQCACQLKVTKQSLKAFLISLPFQLISGVGWLMFVGGFAWSNVDVVSLWPWYEPYSETFVAPYAFLLMAPIFHTIYTIYVLTNVWILGLLTNLSGGLCIVFGGYTLGAFYVPGFVDFLHDFKLTTAGSGVSIFALAIALALLPVFKRYCHSDRQETSYNLLTSPPNDVDCQPRATSPTVLASYGATDPGTFELVPPSGGGGPPSPPPFQDDKETS